jgi:hypothetical protein
MAAFQVPSGEKITCKLQATHYRVSCLRGDRVTNQAVAAAGRLMRTTFLGKPLDFKLLQISLRLGGVVTLSIGLAHLFFPRFGYDSAIPDGMPAAIRDHFYYLATYAIAAFLLSLGTISMLFSRLDHVPSAIAVACVLVAVLWSGRFLLELAYPVEVGLFAVSRPSSLILPAIGVMALLYILAVLANASKFVGTR